MQQYVIFNVFKEYCISKEELQNLPILNKNTEIFLFDLYKPF